MPALRRIHRAFLGEEGGESKRDADEGSTLTIGAAPGDRVSESEEEDTEEEGEGESGIWVGCASQGRTVQVGWG